MDTLVQLPSSAPESRLYFPVTADNASDEYEYPAAGTRLTDFCLDSDRERDAYLRHKRAVAQLPGRAPSRTPGALTDAARSGARALLREWVSQLPALHADAERLGALDQLELDALLYELQEDLVLMGHLPGQAPERARALYMHVCFPGGWDPAQLLGKSFPALHARVPYEPGFERAERAGHAARLFDSPAARFVWSVTPEPTLDRHPATPRTRDWANATSVFLRVERQIMVPLPETLLAREAGSAALFLIRTYVYGRERLSSEQRATLEAAITGMSESMRRYKGMLGHEARILRLLSA